MTDKQTIPILLNLLAAALGALGQYAYKIGGLQMGQVSLLKNYSLWLGVLLFCGVMVLFVMGYKLGGRMSVVYPFYATTFVWGALIGKYLEKEPMNAMMMAGIGLIVTGLILIANSLEKVPS